MKWLFVAFCVVVLIIAVCDSEVRIPAQAITDCNLDLAVDIPSVSEFIWIELEADGNSIEEMAENMRDAAPARCGDYVDIRIILNGITKEITFEELFRAAGFKGPSEPNSVANGVVVNGEVTGFNVPKGAIVTGVSYVLPQEFEQ